MRHSLTRIFRGRLPVGAALLAGPLIAAQAFASCTDGPLPSYPVPDTTLRIVPEQSEVDPSGGSIFVLVEIRQPTDAGSTRPVLVYVRAKGATAEALPGPSLCTDLDAGADAAAGTAQGDITIPDVAFLADDAYNARTSGFTIDVPQGADPVDLVATAYTHDGPASSCVATAPQILAIADARIDRSTADSGAGTGGAGTGGGGTGGGGAGGGGAGGAGAGGAGTGGSTGTGGAGTGGAGKDGG